MFVIYGAHICLLDNELIYDKYKNFKTKDLSNNRHLQLGKHAYNSKEHIMRIFNIFTQMTRIKCCKTRGLHILSSYVNFLQLLRVCVYVSIQIINLKHTYTP